MKLLQDEAFRHILRGENLGIKMPDMISACQVQNKWGRTFLSQHHRYICQD